MELTKKEYIEKYAPKAIRANINLAAVLMYIRLVITLIISFVLIAYGEAFTGIVSVIETLAYSGIIIGFHVGKSKVCAIIWLIYSSISFLCGLLSFSLRGIEVFFMSIWAVRTMKRADLEYNGFINTFKSSINKQDNI